jgi:hypothetical protein
MSGGKTVIQIDKDFLYALYGVIDSGGDLQRLRKTNVYKQALDALEAEATRTREQKHN